MMRHRYLLALAWIAAILAAGIPSALCAQTTPLTAFTLGASPNPVGDGFYTTLTAFVLGSNNAGGTYVPPDGTVAFYVSNSSLSCSTYAGGGYTAAVGANGVATFNYYAGTSGTFPVCASYIPGVGDVYAAGTAGVYLLTVNQPTIFTVSVPAAVIQGTPIAFTFGLTSPTGQTPPTGTITLEDPNNAFATIGTATVTGGVISPNPVMATLSGNAYYAVYSGDSNYASQTVTGTVLIENPLSSITPAAVTAGSGATSVKLNGLGFTANSQVELLTSGTPVILPVSSYTSTQIQTTVPASYLQNPGEVSIEVVTGTVIGGPVQLQVYAPYTDSIAASSPPTSIPYGSTVSTTFNATVTRGVPATDAAVPAGQVSFNLTGTGAQAGYSASLGSAPLSQVSTQGTYLNPFTEPMDTVGTGKLIAADLNGDGYVDVVGLPSYGPSQAASSPYLQVMLSTGFNAFQAEQQVFTGCQESDFAVGDINNDGIPDLVVVCSSAGYASGTVSNLVAYYMLGVGDGTFALPVAFGANSLIGAPTQVVLGQFNGDGYLDIAVIDGVNGNVQVLSPFGNPTNPYGPEVGFDVSSGSVVTAGTADFNQDGFSDIAVEEYSYQYGTGAVFVLLSQGNFNGFYVPSESLFSSTAFALSSMAITDVNGDGYPDVAIADPGLPYTPNDTGNLLVFENDQAGDLDNTFTDPVNSVFAVAGAPFPTIGQPAPGAAAAPGWNLVLTYIGTNSDLWVSELQRQSATSWTGTASFDTTILPLATDSGTEPDFIVTGDMNGDGYLDFALNGTTYTGISACPTGDCELQPWYYSNDAQASLTSSTQLPTPGTYTLSLSYPGDQLYQPSTTPTTSPIQITQATPTGSVSGPGTVTFGANVALTATINGVPGGVAPSQTVTFLDGANPLQTVALLPGSGSTSTASISTTQLTAGLHSISISYSGDANYNAVSNLATTTVQVNAATISLAITSSTAAATSGAMVNFQVQAGGAVLPAGQVIALTGLPTAGNVTVTLNSAGFASYNYGLFPPGTYSIGASFAGNTSFAATTATPVPLQVSATPVSVDLTSSANPVTYPAAFNLTAIATSNGLGVPTGSISLQNNNVQFSTGNLVTVGGSSGLTGVGTIDPVTGLTVVALATGDFNGDGNQDIAALETGGGAARLLISLGNGDGTFQSPVSYTTANLGLDATSVALASADFNNDGYTDLVVVASDGYVMVLLAKNDGSGTLTMSQQFQLTGVTPLAVATGDFNGDGNQDFALIGSTTVMAFYGAGSTPANFPTAGSWSSTSTTSSFTGITVANFDQSGHAEIAVSDNSGPDVAVYLWNGEADTLSSAQTYPVGISASAVASGDINGDGYPDLAVVSNLDSTVDVLINNGKNSPGPGTFGLTTSYGVATQPAAITMADFNQDGYADIAVSGTGAGPGGGATILLGSSTGAMGGETSLPTALGHAIASADFNGDGNPDLVVGLSAAGSGVATFVDSAAQLAANNIQLTAGAAPLTAAYTPASNQFAASTSPILSEQINQATPIITWTAPAAIPYGTALSATQLDAVPSVPGTLTYSPTAGTVLGAGPQTLTVSFVPNDATDYTVASAQVQITVNRAASTVTWTPPAAITYGTALSATQLDATSPVNGTFTYSPLSGTVLHAGLQTLNVTFTPTDTVDYTGSTASVQIQVNQAIPVITWNTPAAIPYGAKLTSSQLNATASTAGTFNYTPTAGTILNAGAQTLNVSFVPSDAIDYTNANGSVQLQVNQAIPVITWPTPAAINYGTVLSATQLNATAIPAGGAFAYAPPAGTTLPLGTQTLRVTYTPPAADAANYTTASASVSIQVNPGLVLTSILPTNANYGAGATLITLTGTGFTSTSVVQLNGTTISSTYTSPTSLNAVIPASFLQQTQPGAITVTTGGVTTPALTFTVNLPSIELEFSGPGTAPAGQQPTLNLAFLEGYPLPLQVTLTLSVKPATEGGPVDPAVQFSTGGSTFDFTLPANSTTVPAIQLQAGTVASTITVTLALQANGQDLTPTGLQPVVIDVPAAAPVITGVTLTRDGINLTVTIQGYSTTRDMTDAAFTFTPASGDTISDPKLTVELGTSFATWYGKAASDEYGSAFTYTQNFTLSNDASTIGGVSVTLTNSIGTSTPGTAN